MRYLRPIRWLLPSFAALRLGTYLVFAFTIAALLAARSLRADIKEAALSAGHELARIGDLLQGVETININGERMHHSSGYVDQDVATVLQRVESYCGESPSFLGQAMTEAEKAHPSAIGGRSAAARAFRLGFIQDVAADRGMIACFVDSQASGLADMARRLRRFLVTRQLSEFGGFRYVYAEAQGPGKSHVVATWADSPLDLRTMFPASGDAGGADSQLLPRPPASRRTFAVAVEGHPHALRLYTSHESKAAVLAFYDRWMAEHQFQVVEGAHDVKGSSGYIRPDGYQAFLTLGEKDDLTFVALTESGKIDGSGTASVETFFQ
jgi:hypothetical protein